MLSRALSLAAVTLLIGSLVAIPVRAQNLEAGKSPSQIFAGTCTACHKSPRGLLKTVPASSLPGYLRQHYTTSSEMAGLLSAFLVSNGATDSRYVGTKPTQQPRDARPPVPEQLDRQGRPIRPAATSQEAARPSDAQPAARPDADGIVPPNESGARHGRNAKRMPRSPGDVPEAARPAVEGQAPAAGEGGPDGRKSGAKQKLSKRGKPGGEEPPKTGAATGVVEPAKGETAKDDAAKSDTPKSETPATDTSKAEPAKSESAKDGTGKPEGAKPPGEGKSEPAKVDAIKETGGETPASRADPVPAVTPAPPAAPAPSTAAANGVQEPAAPPSVPGPPPAVTTSPPPPAVAPAGPPVAPISH
jgi:hypothetical protein